MIRLFASLLRSLLEPGKFLEDLRTWYSYLGLRRNSSMIEGSLVISPPNEQVLFRNRWMFDLVIIYGNSTSLGHPMTPMSSLSRSLFENAFHCPLKRPPMVLIGGLQAWKAVVGNQGIIKRLPHTIGSSIAQD
jgi:hypothetical protein